MVLYNCICVIFVSVMDLAQCCRDSNPPVLAGNLPFSVIISSLLFSFNILPFLVTFLWQRKIMCSQLHQCSPWSPLEARAFGAHTVVVASLHQKALVSFVAKGWNLWCCYSKVFFSFQKGPCLEYLLQHKILDTLHTLGRADVSITFPAVGISFPLK